MRQFARGTGWCALQTLLVGGLLAFTLDKASGEPGLVKPPAAQAACTLTQGLAVSPRFEREVQNLESRAHTTPPGQGVTVFVGSSTFARWRSLERDFAAFGAINQGFGGSTLAEVNYYSDRLVTPFNPQTVVIYAGTNDVADGHSAATVLADLQALVHHLRHHLPHSRLIVLSMNIPPARVAFAPVYREANQAIANWLRTQPGTRYLDVAHAMYDAAGNPQPALFVRDMIHMNRKGQARWILPIKRALADP